jgi:Pyruvate/2-oxoacid:ferredoxin oxidoreductase delta subunit
MKIVSKKENETKLVVQMEREKKYTPEHLKRDKSPHSQLNRVLSFNPLCWIFCPRRCLQNKGEDFLSPGGAVDCH